MIETGERLPTPPFLRALEQEFPKRAQEIQTEAARYRPSPESDDVTKWAIRGIEAQIETGEHDAESAASWANLRSEAYERQIDYQAIRELPDVTQVSLWDQVICSRLENEKSSDTHKALNAGLERYTDAALLWYRKGMIEWKEGKLSSAHAALDVALKRTRPPRMNIYCVRGLIFVEWGKFREALRDLDAALKRPRQFPEESAAARPAQVYVACLLGELSDTEVFAEFERLEKVMPDNGWLFYYRGHCNVYVGNEAQGREEWEEGVLNARTPSVSEWKAIQARNVTYWWRMADLSDDHLI
jgi:tetratricopeptide (TPR) repeat protein